MKYFVYENIYIFVFITFSSGIYIVLRKLHPKSSLNGTKLFTDYILQNPINNNE